jgi:Reverse transcriptase (RNA-dependent DNA polymerase)
MQTLPFFAHSISHLDSGRCNWMKNHNHSLGLQFQGKVQYRCVTSPMGLLGCPASFQRLMETVLRNINNVLIFIDDVLLHMATHEEHLKVLEKVFERLHQNHLKVNQDTCVFGNREVSYLGFMLTPEGMACILFLPGLSLAETSYRLFETHNLLPTSRWSDLLHSHQRFCNHRSTSVQGHQKGLRI